MIQTINGYKMNVCYSCSQEHKPFKIMSNTNRFCQMCFYHFDQPTFKDTMKHQARICLPCSKSFNLCQLCGEPIEQPKQLTFQHLISEKEATKWVTDRWVTERKVTK